MPLTRSAIKKLRRDRKVEAKNESFKKLLEDNVRKAKKAKSEKEIQKAVSLIDKAVKKNIYHKNKAARLKSNLSKLLSKPQAKKEVEKPVKPSKPKAKKSAKTATSA